MHKLILIRGLPGSGKSTLARNLLERYTTFVWSFRHFEADQYFIAADGVYNFNPKLLKNAHTWCQCSTSYWLRNGATVIVSNTFTTLKEMQPYLDMADRYKTGVEVVK